MPELETGRKLHWGGLVLALLVFAIGVWHSQFLIDDAFISFRYAKNWAGGHGLVYNIGNPQPVEGYSNFAWVALLAAGHRIGLPLEGLSQVLGWLSGAMTLILTEQVLRCRLGLDKLRTGIVLIALAALPVFHVWCSGGLETAFFGLLMLATWIRLTSPKDSMGHDIVTGAFGGVLLLTRPEGVVWVLGLLLAAWIGQGKLAPRRWVPYLAVALAIGFLQLLWRHSFYGSWLPNTVHAKSSLSGSSVQRGARTLATWGLLFLWPLLALGAPLATRATKPRRLALSACVVLLGGLAYNLLVGGDWMPFFRFMAPLSAFFAIALGVLLTKLGSKSLLVCSALGILIAGLPVVDVMLIPQGLRETLYFRQFRIGYQTEWARLQTGRRNTLMYSALGRALDQAMQPTDSWTGGAIGAVGYYSGIQILGRNGLVNREVAKRQVNPGEGTAGHEKRVPRIWFRDQAPTFYDCMLHPKRIRPSGPAFDKAVGELFKGFVADPHEEGLRNSCYVEARPVKDVPGLPAASTLMLLMHTDDPAKADAFWSRYGV
ncbi:MAG: hypothetical protein ACI9F9_001217 [Candidatus Paceibacteria bacterium]|jgi:hypothetical protein